MGGSNETTNPGFYAGYVASSFTFGRFLSGYVWGSATDIIGRKPVIIIGLLSITIFSMIFGMSETYSMAITTRFALFHLEIVVGFVLGCCCSCGISTRLLLLVFLSLLLTAACACENACGIVQTTWETWHAENCLAVPALREKLSIPVRVAPDMLAEHMSR